MFLNKKAKLLMLSSIFSLMLWSCKHSRNYKIVKSGFAADVTVEFEKRVTVFKN
ncbi:hypothetical protein [uncultured Algibacter sp.]|uniref:hypothetical protein n=1 Tax=uncultured Algibacter sp. TaxID=298659 RepID=UPI00262906DB|nr:hypothetical protein [uncultured Algibacter sp.]